MWRRCALVAAVLSLFELPQVVSAELQARPPVANIVNGVPTQGFPTVGALGTFDAMGNPLPYCTGTLIGCETVLTAAHCVCPEGTTDAASCLSAGVDPPGQVLFFLQHAGIFPARSIVISPEYNGDQAGDIAVIKLATGVTGVAPSAINRAQKPPLGTAGTIVGFGEDGFTPTSGGVKRAGLVTTGTCPTGIPSATHLCWNFVAPIGPPGTVSNTCNGDSGGPLFADSGDGFVLAGETRGGGPSCLPPSMSWDTDVFTYRSFVQTQGGPDISNTQCGDLPSVGQTGTAVTVASDYLPTFSALAYSFEVPPGAQLLRVALNGETSFGLNNLSLYIRAGALPSLTTYDCADFNPLPVGFCQISRPAAGTWYAAADAASGSGHFQLTATTFEAPLPSATTTPTATATRHLATPTGTAPPPKTPTATATAPGPPICVGDCNGDHTVAINELIIGVNIALGSESASACPTFENGQGKVDIAQLVKGVDAALNGCPH